MTSRIKIAVLGFGHAILSLSGVLAVLTALTAGEVLKKKTVVDALRAARDFLK